MSELTIPERVAAERAADENVVHTVCCNEDLADCGADVSDWDDVCDGTATTCPVCAIAEANDLPCTDPDCPYREGAVS